MKWLYTFAIVLFASPSYAAIPKKPVAVGISHIKELRTRAFDSKLTLEQRWKALMALARIGQKDAVPDIERAIVSNDWFMRDAGLRAIEKVDKPATQKWAKALIADPALVVRTTAVGILKRNPDSKTRDLLWERLYSSQNYRGSQSLWVRRHIVEALAVKPENNDKEKFQKILEDKDKTLHKPALAALEKIKKT